MIRESTADNVGTRSSADAFPLIMLSGLRGGGRIFDALRGWFPSMLTPAWLAPRENEPLPRYARRMACMLRIDRPCVLGGVSFGAIVAQEMTRCVDARACFVISSIRNPSELPPWMRWSRVAGCLLEGDLQRITGVASSMFGRMMSPAVLQGLDRFAARTNRFERWAMRTILRWRPHRSRTPVHAIHGERDRTFPLRYVHPDEVVRGADHMLISRHAPTVADFIRRRLSVCDQPEPFSSP